MADEVGASNDNAEPALWGLKFQSSHRAFNQSASLPPPTVPDHELICHIGGGSSGDVWLARNALGTMRAVKIVHRKSFEEKDAFDREFNGLQKFEPISRTHEGLVDILQVGRTEECLYYVMELADDVERSNRARESRSNGQAAADRQFTTPTLQHSSSYSPRTIRSDLSQRGRLPVEECIEIVMKLTSALKHLHQNGLVHRDIKPSNIIFVKDQPKLADIGLVTETTEANSYVGTLGYIPREGPGTTQADLFSLGKVLYEISTGCNLQNFPKLPAGFDDFPDRRGLVELNEIMLKACDDNPRIRYHSAHQMGEELLWLRRGRSVRRVHTFRRCFALGRNLIIVILGLMLVGAGSYYAWQALNSIPKQSDQPYIGAAETAVKEGEYMSALFNFTKALKQNRHEEGHQRTIRSRIAQTLQKMPMPAELAMNIGGEVDLRFGAEGTRVIILDGGQTVDVYDRRTGQFLFPLVHKLPVLSAGFNLDSSNIFTLPKNGQARFWQAESGTSIAGKHFAENFRNPPKDWKQTFKAAGDVNKITFAHRNGFLGIQVQSGSELGSAILRPPLGFWADALVSLDILDWDENAPGQSIGLTARGTGWDNGGCVGLVTFHDPALNGKASMHIFEKYSRKPMAVAVDPEKAYRLVFLIFGREAHLHLFELNSGEVGKPIASRNIADITILNSGRFGIWAHANYGKNSYDVTVDNFAFIGIKQ